VLNRNTHGKTEDWAGRLRYRCAGSGREEVAGRMLLGCCGCAHLALADDHRRRRLIANRRNEKNL